MIVHFHPHKNLLEQEMPRLLDQSPNGKHEWIVRLFDIRVCKPFANRVQLLSDGHIADSIRPKWEKVDKDSAKEVEDEERKVKKIQWSRSEWLYGGLVC